MVIHLKAFKDITVYRISNYNDKKRYESEKKKWANEQVNKGIDQRWDVCHLSILSLE